MSSVSSNPDDLSLSPDGKPLVPVAKTPATPPPTPERPAVVTSRIAVNPVVTVDDVINDAIARLFESVDFIGNFKKDDFEWCRDSRDPGGMVRLCRAGTDEEYVGTFIARVSVNDYFWSPDGNHYLNSKYKQKPLSDACARAVLVDPAHDLLSTMWPVVLEKIREIESMHEDEAQNHKVVVEDGLKVRAKLFKDRALCGKAADDDLDPDGEYILSPEADITADGNHPHVLVHWVGRGEPFNVAVKSLAKAGTHVGIPLAVYANVGGAHLKPDYRIIEDVIRGKLVVVRVAFSYARWYTTQGAGSSRKSVTTSNYWADVRSMTALRPPPRKNGELKRGRRAATADGDDASPSAKRVRVVE